MVYLQDLQDRMDGTAQDLAGRVAAPEQWADWLLYLMEVLDAEAQQNGKREAYTAMLAQVRDSLDGRVSQGSWWSEI